MKTYNSGAIHDIFLYDTDLYRHAFEAAIWYYTIIDIMPLCIICCYAYFSWKCIIVVRYMILVFSDAIPTYIGRPSKPWSHGEMSGSASRWAKQKTLTSTQMEAVRIGDVALALMDEMDEAGIKADVITYGWGAGCFGAGCLCCFLWFVGGACFALLRFASLCFALIWFACLGLVAACSACLLLACLLCSSFVFRLGRLLLDTRAYT